MTTDLVGTKLGQYRIIELISRDEVTLAYKAWQPSLERYVMLKVLAPSLSQDPELVRQFLRGAEAAARLGHPHMVKILDFGSESGYSYAVLQFVEGTSLEQLVRSGVTFTLQQITNIASHIASALDYAHGRGIIHRGVKSANILIDGTGRAVLTGFGIAEALTGSGTITKTGALIDTACYASPEMIRDRPLDHRSDLYSLGIVCYEMLAGEVPFRGDSPHTTFLAQLHAPPPPLPVPPAVEAVLHKMLAKRPEQRYDSAGEFVRQLTLATQSPTDGLPASPPPDDQVPQHRRREMRAFMTALGKWKGRRQRQD